MDFRHCQILDPVGDAVAFPKSIEFWKDRRITAKFYSCSNRIFMNGTLGGNTAVVNPKMQGCRADCLSAYGILQPVAASSVMQAL
jgi:hypothetical protein